MSSPTSPVVASELAYEDTTLGEPLTNIALRKGTIEALRIVPIRLFDGRDPDTSATFNERPVWRVVALVSGVTAYVALFETEADAVDYITTDPDGLLA
jgi:hypothetical protein